MIAGVVLMTLACWTSLCDAGNFTVTDEAWFHVVVADLLGPGRNYSGKFVVALFGETVPMTVMNFVAITRGYERVNQVHTVRSVYLIVKKFHSGRFSGKMFPNG